MKTTETVSKYFTDGRGEINTTSRNELIESKTEWNGNKIVITVYQTNKNGEKKVDLTKELNVSKDKEKLTIKSTPSQTGFSSLFGNSFNKMVFKASK